MKRIIINLFAFISMTNICLSQWTEWYPVHTAIQVSFKYGKKGTDYSWMRFKNVSNQEFSTIRVEFEKFNNGIAETTGFSTFNVKPQAISESKGSWFNTDQEVRNIRLTKLEDKNHKDVLKSNSQQNGVNEIYFPKKQQAPQEAKQQAEDEETEKRLKARQEQEKRKQEELKRQNDVATQIKEQRIRKQDELAIQKNNQDEANKQKYKEQEEANKKSKKEISNSINEAGNIILKGINDAEAEREERKRIVQAEVEKMQEERSKSNATSNNSGTTQRVKQDEELVGSLLSPDDLADLINVIDESRINTKFQKELGSILWTEKALKLKYILAI